MRNKIPYARLPPDSSHYNKELKNFSEDKILSDIMVVLKLIKILIFINFVMTRGGTIWVQYFMFFTLVSRRLLSAQYCLQQIYLLLADLRQVSSVG